MKRIDDIKNLRNSEQKLLNSLENAPNTQWINCANFAMLFAETQKIGDVSQDTKNKSLIIAAKKNNHLLLKYLLVHNADVNFPDSQGDTPLHIAAIYGNEKMARCLIEMGANVGITNEESKTALDILLEKIATTNASLEAGMQQKFYSISIETLENIQVLLSDPERFRKEQKIRYDHLNIKDLDTVLESEIISQNELQLTREQEEQIINAPKKNDDALTNKPLRKISFSIPKEIIINDKDEVLSDISDDTPSTITQTRLHSSKKSINYLKVSEQGK